VDPDVDTEKVSLQRRTVIRYKQIKLRFSSETWTVKARDATRITAAEMKYMRRTAGYTRTDYNTNI